MGTQEVPSGMRKNLITLRMTEQWNRLSRETVKYLSLEIFTAQLDAFRCHREPGKKKLNCKDFIRKRGTGCVFAARNR